MKISIIKERDEIMKNPPDVFIKLMVTIYLTGSAAAICGYALFYACAINHSSNTCSVLSVIL